MAKKSHKQAPAAQAAGNTTANTARGSGKPGAGPGAPVPAAPAQPLQASPPPAAHQSTHSPPHHSTGLGSFGPAPNKYFIGGLRPHMRQKDFEDYFAQFGKVMHIDIKEGRGFAFMIFASSPPVLKQELLGVHVVDDKRVTVREYMLQDPPVLPRAPPVPQPEVKERAIPAVPNKPATAPIRARSVSSNSAESSDGSSSPQSGTPSRSAAASSAPVWGTQNVVEQLFPKAQVGTSVGSSRPPAALPIPAAAPAAPTAPQAAVRGVVAPPSPQKQLQSSLLDLDGPIATLSSGQGVPLGAPLLPSPLLSTSQFLPHLSAAPTNGGPQLTPGAIVKPQTAATLQSPIGARQTAETAPSRPKEDDWFLSRFGI